MDAATIGVSIAVSLLGSSGLSVLIAHALDQRAYRGRAHFDRYQSQRQTVDAVHGHVMAMTVQLQTRPGSYAAWVDWSASPDEANDLRLGSLAETPDGRFIVEQYMDCKTAMRQGNNQGFAAAAHHVDIAVERWRAAYP